MVRAQLLSLRPVGHSVSSAPFFLLPLGGGASEEPQGIIQAVKVRAMVRLTWCEPRLAWNSDNQQADAAAALHVSEPGMIKRFWLPRVQVLGAQRCGAVVLEGRRRGRRMG